MKYILSEYSPEPLFRYFEDICTIPHGSGNEVMIADFLCEFAKAHGLEYYKDEINNVLIKKKASAGFEDHSPVLLQGHTDMVCEKNADTIHDFEKDPLKLYEKDGWLYAEGTTLGADDGVAVAMMMAVLADENAKHPPLECMFTVEEETGMGGAIGFDYSKLSAKRFINLDSETLDSAIVSCAGGVKTEFCYEFSEYKLQNDVIKLSLKGLAGGHSGIDINSGRENANIIMAKVLGELYSEMPFNLISINGGNKSNAIPRECECVISVFDKKQVKESVARIGTKIKKQLISDDKKFSLRVTKCEEMPDTMFCFKDTSTVISAMNLAPNGVYTMSKNMEGLVESSSNLGIVKTLGNKIVLTFMPRSSVEPKLDEIIMKLEMLAKLTGAKVVHSDRHPGWEYKKENPVRDLFSECYEKKFGKKPILEAVHAGLECGIICDHMGEMDGVSMSAEVCEIHTPNERLNLRSLTDAYEIMLDMLENM